METTERIVEAYVRYVKGWATIPNLGCDGQNEIDLFAIDPDTDDRWHIEVSVSVSSAFSALTNESFERARNGIAPQPGVSWASSSRRSLNHSE